MLPASADRTVQKIFLWLSGPGGGGGGGGGAAFSRTPRCKKRLSSGRAKGGERGYLLGMISYKFSGNVHSIRGDLALTQKSQLVLNTSLL